MVELNTGVVYDTEEEIGDPPVGTSYQLKDDPAPDAVKVTEAEVHIVTSATVGANGVGITVTSRAVLEALTQPPGLTASP